MTEALNAEGRSSASERLLACVEENCAGTPKELLDRLLSAVAQFVADAAQHDDVTALVLRYEVRLCRAGL